MIRTSRLGVDTESAVHDFVGFLAFLGQQVLK